MAKYQKYAEYNDSGIEWLGEIPRHWEIKKLVWFFSAEKGKNGQLLTKEYCGLNTGEFPVYSGQTENNGIMGSIDSYEFDVGNNGVLFSTTVGAKAMTLSFLQGKFSLSQNCMIIKPRKNNISTRFYYYHCQPLFSKERGLIPEHMQASFRVEDLYSYRISLPPITEQVQIANFLDHETAQIDTLIAKQEKLIELLKEKRQAVISHAVTKGLNPNVPMKDSGVEWLGEVPEHWRVIKFNHVVQIRNGLVDPRDEKFKNLVLYAPNHIEKATGKILYKETAEEQGADSNKYLCFKGEVIYSKIRPALAKVAICEEATALCSADMYPMDSYNGLTNQFLYYFILSDSFTEAVILDSDRVAMPKINRESLSDYKLPIPPINEQLKIIDFIEMTGKKLDCLETKAAQAIQLMQERRTALISAAVTGKIDVRNWQNPNKNKEANMELSA